MRNDTIPLAMVLDCIYIYTYWSHVYTDLGETIGNIDLERMRNTWCMSLMSLICSYNHEEILESDHESHVFL